MREVQKKLLEHGGYLLPYLDVEPGHPWFLSMQRIGATGVMKGVGRNSGWENQSFFRANDPTLLCDLAGLKEIYLLETDLADSTFVSVSYAIELIEAISEHNDLGLDKKSIDLALEAIGLEPGDKLQRTILRGELAALLDITVDPFEFRDVDLYGEYMDIK